MAKTKTKADKRLYDRLRDSGVRKKVASTVSEALPKKGSKQPSLAHRMADELSHAADSIRERAGGGSRKRSQAAKKAARTRKAIRPPRTRKANAAKRRSSARKDAKTRSKS